ncbi:GAF domain-containing protein [Pedobacter sp. WC2423]|uniref:GAF domain-containing protein n=1 Tax=Pedobacter sp. WC2423 TaxID=3234142 RepID=UPI003466E229
MSDSILKTGNTVNRFLHRKIDREDELQQIVELAANICNVPIAMITFMDDQTQHIKFKAGTDHSEISFTDTFCKYTVIQKELLIIPDTLVDERVKNNPSVVQNPHLRFYAGSPLTTHDDYNIGTLCVYDIQPKTLTTIEQKMLHRLARQVTRLLEFDASLQLLKEQYEFSRVEEIKLRSFFESSGCCHLLLDTQLRVLSFNNAMVNLLRSNYQLTIAEGMEVNDYIETGFVEEFIRNCKRALKGENVNIEAIINPSKGNNPWQLIFEPAFDSMGAITGVTYSATDITQMVRDEKTVLEQGESLRQIDRILSADLHHPLEVIKGAMSKMKQQGYPDGIIEFELLEKACNELLNKGSLIILSDERNIGYVPSSLTLPYK